MGTLLSSPCQLRLEGWLSHLRLGYYMEHQGTSAGPNLMIFSALNPLLQGAAILEGGVNIRGLYQSPLLTHQWQWARVTLTTN